MEKRGGLAGGILNKHGLGAKRVEGAGMEGALELLAWTETRLTHLSRSSELRGPRRRR